MEHEDLLTHTRTLRTTDRRWLRSASALFAGATIAVLGASLPAVADHSPVDGASPPAPVVDVEIEGPVVRVARGAAVQVPLRIVCSGAPGVDVYGSLRQSVGTVLRTGYGYTTAPCDNEAHSVVLSVTGDRRAFVPGKAFAQVTAYLSDWSASDEDEEQVIIRLR